MDSPALDGHYTTGEIMNNQHQTIIQILTQNVPPWLGVAIGHWASDVLSIVAIVTTIAYNVVNIRAHLRKGKVNDQF